MFDFNYIDRKNTDCLKWDYFDDEIPMWVADMDFRLAPAILEAIENRARHPVFAYNKVPEELYDSYISWWQRRYDLKMERDELLFATGVLASITSILRVFTKEGDNVLLQTPVYHSFFHVIENNNRNVLENPLIFNDGRYSIDFDDLDKKLAHTKVFILCNPHNPIGKIWSGEDLKKMCDLCKKHDVVLVSDEIHGDLTDPGIKYNPCARFSDYEKIITTIAPTKTFNIAGIQNSMIFTRNKEIHELLEKRLVSDFFSEINSFSAPATIAAFNESEDWLEELREVIYENKVFLDEYLKENIPQIKMIESEATYLMWLDISSIPMKSQEFSDYLREKQGLFLSPGIEFGQNGDDFLRMNIACPRELLIKGLEALKRGVNEVFKGD